MSELSLVSIDDLIAEIYRRTDALIIGYLQSLDKKQEATQFYYFGGRYTAIGLARHMQMKIENEIREQKEEL